MKNEIGPSTKFVFTWGGLAALCAALLWLARMDARVAYISQNMATENQVRELVFLGERDCRVLEEVLERDLRCREYRRNVLPVASGEGVAAGGVENAM